MFLFQPENILLDAEGNAKLVDMGESIEFQGQDDTVSGTKGTRGFLAPELVDMDRTEDCRGIPVDIWALGITLYSMLFGDIPFSGQTGLELYENIAKQPLSIPEEPVISDDVKSMLHGLLQKDPDKRSAFNSNITFLSTHFQYEKGRLISRVFGREK